MHPKLSDIYGDPRIFENPIEASIELADLTAQRIPGLKRRSSYLSAFGLAWTVVMSVLLIYSGLFLWDLWVSADILDLLEVVAGLVLTGVLVPSVGLGITLLLLSFQERRFLPYLEQTTMAMKALEGAPVRKELMERIQDADEDEEGLDGGSIAGILGSAMWVGNMVPVVSRMTTVSRAILALVLLGLGSLVTGSIVALSSGLLILYMMIVQIAVFAIFIAPSIILFQWLSRDHDLYQYYSLRQQALEQVASIGIPPVPKGKDHLERFDTFLKADPVVKAMLGSKEGGVKKDVGRKGHRFSRYYHGTLLAERTGILVSEMDHIPDNHELDRSLEEAIMFGERQGANISRVVALVTVEAEDIGDKVYDHIIAQGRRTRPGECALQLVMEVEGIYSLVPYVAM